MKKKISILIVLLGMITSGCVTFDKKMLNTSPLQNIPLARSIKPIPATVMIRSDQKDFISDVTIALKKHSVFKEVISEGGPGDLELFVTSTTQSDHHFSEGMGKAVLSGLTLGIASLSQVDPFDFSITVKAQLKKGKKIIAEYETTGSYHSEVHENALPTTKVKQVQTAVFLSYEHALSLLASEIKRDSKRIQSHL